MSINNPDIYNAEIWIQPRETMTTSNQENMFLRAVRKKEEGTENFRFFHSGVI